MKYSYPDKFTITLYFAVALKNIKQTTAVESRNLYFKIFTLNRK